MLAKALNNSYFQNMPALRKSHTIAYHMKRNQDLERVDHLPTLRHPLHLAQIKPCSRHRFRLTRDLDNGTYFPSVNCYLPRYLRNSLDFILR